MPPETAYPDALNKPDVKAGFRSIGWKDLMNEFLMGTDVFRNETGSERCLNPNIVMDMRHEMVKRNLKNSPLCQEQIHTKALELLRTENHDKLRKQREGKLVEKEIAKLQQVWENRRLSTQKTLDEPTKRTNSSKSRPIVPKHFAKLRRRSECYNGTCEVETWISRSIQMTMETKISPQGIPFDVKVSLQRQELIEDDFRPVSARKGSMVDEEIEPAEHFWEEDEGKNEIMRRFFENGLTEVEPEREVFQKKKINTREMSEIRNKINQRKVERAWVTWKNYIDQLKNRRKEKTIYRGKIEAFLSKLQESEIKDKEVKPALSKKEEMRRKILERAKIRNKNFNNEVKDEKIKKIVQEIKESREETVNALREITKTNLENQRKYRNLKFLQRMEERKEERLKRRNEIQEKKRILEEEREIARKQKEDEEKRKRLEELKEKRRIEREKMEEQRQEREKLKANMNLADGFYRKYLLRRRGMAPWMALLKIRDLQEQQAVAFFEKRLLQKTLLGWVINVREETGLKRRCADEFYERMLMKNCLWEWMEFHKERMEQNQAAVDWDEYKTTERAFKTWLRFTLDERIKNLDKDNIAVLQYEQKLKTRYLKKMRDYPELKKLEQAKENRKRKWRQKVKEILPDFQPAEISDYT